MDGLLAHRKREWGWTMTTAYSGAGLTSEGGQFPMGSCLSHLTGLPNARSRVQRIVRVNLHRARSARRVLLRQRFAWDGTRLWREGRAASVEGAVVLCPALPASWREDEPERCDGHSKRHDTLESGSLSGSHGSSRPKAPSAQPRLHPVRRAQRRNSPATNIS